MSEKRIINLKEVNFADIPLVGGKAAFLGELIQSGYSVPPGYVISTNIFKELITNTELLLDIEGQINTLDTRDIANLERVSESIVARVSEIKIPSKIKNEILSAFDKLGSKQVAVRSSATVEDGKNLAWAGQLDTFLSVSRENLFECVKACWASMYSPRALYYRLENSFVSKEMFMGVIIQEMIRSEISGVCFSVHPITQNANHLLIEACLGLGEKLVSGHIHPDNYVIDKSDLIIISKQINNQKEGTFCTNGDCVAIDIDHQQSISQKLKDTDMMNIAKIVIKIEDNFGFPCDVEWCISKNKVYILQTRPITTLKKDPLEIQVKKYKMLRSRQLKLVSCMWNYTSRTHPITEDTHGTRLPQAWNLYEPSGDLTAFVVEDEWKTIGAYFKNLYINDPFYLPRIYEKQQNQGKKLMSISAKLLESDLKNKTPQQLVREYKKIKENWEKFNSFNSIPWLVGADYLEEHLLEEAQDFEMQRNDYKLLSTTSERSFSSDEELKIIELCLKIIRKRQKKYFKNSKVKIKDLPKWIIQEIDNLVDYYYWIPFGYDGPNLYDRKHYISVLRKYLKKDKDELSERYMELSQYTSTISKQHDTILKKYNLNNYFIRKVRYLHTFSTMAEERKEVTFKAHIAMHEIFKVLGKKLGISEVAFKYLSFDELKKYLKKPDKILEISSRRIENPYIVYFTNGEYEIIEDPEEVQRISEELIPKLDDVKKLNGITVSTAGKKKLKGKVKVLRDHKEMGKVDEGDILVATMTTPEYAPAMRKASAIVTDEGGMTCHAAILSRELKIPCIIGTKIATKILKDKEKVELDLTSNMIIRLSK